jgi:heme-degrading monooxygenase HmoA
MIASMSTFRASDAEVAEMARIAGASMEGWLRGFEGYCGLLMLADQENGRARVFTFWESLEAAEASEESRAHVRNDVAQRIGAELESVELHEVAYHADLALD